MRKGVKRKGVKRKGVKRKYIKIKYKNNIRYYTILYFVITMISQDYILLIFNCVKYRYKALRQKETWLRQLSKLQNNIIYYHVLGDPDLADDYFFDEEQRILWLRVADDYNSLPKKVINAYEAISKVYDFKYIFKTDDDQIVLPITFFDSLIKVINSRYTDISKRVHYGGHVIDVKEAYKSEYYQLHPELPKNLIVNKTQYCSGRFYLLSHNAIASLLFKKDDICNEFLEDYAIGFHMPVPVFKENILRLDTGAFFTDFV